ncbi:2-succinyl-5-enolpyruvyl-6-hydroxy-3-cyclohexene-1-carboxylic-acid synthase [Porifericola rhodea]|uniref:2-succinyl-5-enolpyruvyl-6-hydroxy-3- cyclohexene-1-carboxylic-acid synthase n=1 Tax=Porifericola rhodea TaxID=930972 RepID=UPI0026670B12|nr:2-succinyl-5-enolpyruvyl-6-hydroxy-3-cyclohexene-1-carboxylic-acid synthase [Porifericola rhodea]WKN32417.1 2-succinyl-5-enolpyruvyl-6-hydroxy-3-cyclohexene-1-carboxylic-acid synthase [Porifericola rhodea]
MILPSIINTVQICARLGVRQAILSPGSRCAPLSIAFARHPQIQTRTMSDERSAAFVAMGIARQTREVVVLVCTSGSAAYNYAPAIAEAYFQQIPLLVLTADRPPEWIDQLDGQTIRQQDIYGKHIKTSFHFPVGQSAADQWHAGRMVSEAINTSTGYPQGPVHINVPIREPFYPEKGEELKFDDTIKVIQQQHSAYLLSNDIKDVLSQSWQKSGKKLIVCGQGLKDKALSKALLKISHEHHIPVVADIISNRHDVEGALKHADVFLAQKDEGLLHELQADLLISFGLSVMSKNLKLYLRKFKPKQHWHLQECGQAADTFQSLTKLIHCSPLSFFEAMREVGAQNDMAQTQFAQKWKTEEKKAVTYIKSLFLGVNHDFSQPNEFQAVQTVVATLPDHSNLHLANSMSVRYANLIGLSDKQAGVEVFANRGTSGIDGSNSTAVGSALACDKLTVLLTGDLAFFYDRNAFWHNYQLPNLRVVLLNNHAGGIFGMIDGPAQQPELEEYFETRQRLEAENTAKDFGMQYQRIELKTQADVELLREELSGLYRKDSEHAKILEVVTNTKANAQVFKSYKTLINQNYGLESSSH